MLGLQPGSAPPDYTEHQKLFTPESWARLSATLPNTVNDGTPYELEPEMVRPDGSHGWMLARGEAVRNADGVIVALRGVATDITERKKAEELIRLASQYSRSLLEASLDPLVTISAEGKISDVNTATEQVTGIGRSALIGSDFAGSWPGMTSCSLTLKPVGQTLVCHGRLKSNPQLKDRHQSSPRQCVVRRAHEDSLDHFLSQDRTVVDDAASRLASANQAKVLAGIGGCRGRCR
jgi:PAS domain-containing protein